MTWTPILDGDLAAKAREAILGVLEAIAVPRWDDSWSNYTLLEGEPGSVLLYAYAAKAGLISPDAMFERASGLSERAPAHLQGVYLWKGLAGVMWTLEHVAAMFDPEDNAPIDETLLGLLDEAIPFELLGGACGLAIYGEPHLRGPEGRLLFAKLARNLAASATVDAAGARWHTSPNLLSGEALERYPNGYVTLGLAHGLAAPIAVLGIACREQLEVAIARPLLERALEWLWQQEQPVGARRQRFPSISSESSGGLRGSWCYGDLGIATAVEAAARYASLPAHRQRAIELAREIAGRPASQDNLDNPMMCHGTAGLAQMMSRWAQRTGEPIFRDAARVAFERTLAMRVVGTGAGGFSAVDYEAGGKRVQLTQLGLLDGSAGVALALLGGISDVEPQWDRAFML